MYFKHGKILGKFVSIIIHIYYFIYKTAPDNGVMNANTTAEFLGINICNNINEQVNLCFNSFSNAKDKFIYFTENFKWDENFPYKDSVLFKLGNFIAKNRQILLFFSKIH